MPDRVYSSRSQALFPATGNGPGRLLPRLTRTLAGWLTDIGDRLFLRDDARARARGWQIQARHGGLTRVYRDPRFALLRQGPGSGSQQPDPVNQHGSGCAGQMTVRRRPSPALQRTR